LTSGCSREVCAAEDIATTCEVVPLPAGSCGCVNRECIWHQNGAPPDAGNVECGDGQGCVAFSNYCDGCNCEALPEGSTPPPCSGVIVSCFVDPCMNHNAACVNGRCLLE
jgi:hypothetical protein